ncbi:MAG: methyltransferase domain-containing protein [Gemmatimonadaceae bacterium]|jgi:SAM-dependent methyltransferase|nr:methyltransferase domain-containing protein [Gemmatimonadaceae bacterium]
MACVLVVVTSATMACAQSSPPPNQREGKPALGRAPVPSAARSSARASAVARGAADTVPAPGSMPATAFPRPARAVATIVAPRWTNEDDRDDAHEAERVMALVGVKPGMRIADIGAGDGYYVVRLSPRVGPSGVVYGEDIVPQYLELLRERVTKQGLSNVRVVFGRPHDPQLPPASIDAALLIHMYHEIEQPFGLLYHLIPSLVPGGRIAVLDLDRPTWGHGTPPALLRCELGAMGFREVGWEWLRDGEYVALFEAPPVARRPTPEELRARLSRTPCLP